MTPDPQLVAIVLIGLALGLLHAGIVATWQEVTR